MVEYAPPTWVTSLRFLTLGTVLTGLILSIWWLTRLADHLEGQRQLLVSIQRDVLLNQSKVEAVLAVSDQNSRRLIGVEERTGRAAEDRMQMREVDQELMEAMIRLRAELSRDAPTGFPAVPKTPAPPPRVPR
jgi:hypothetical protein